MNWTFGIITDGSHPERVEHQLTSILHQTKLPAEQFQIIIVGGAAEHGSRSGLIEHIPFDESYRPNWITRKKNLIAQSARHEHLCLLHDYVALQPGWVEGFRRFGSAWDVAMNPIANRDGTRYRDWCCLPHGFVDLPYDDTSRVHRDMYASGTYFCVQRAVLQQYPLDESLCWGQGEDVEWCGRLRAWWRYRLNLHSPARLLKQKAR